MRGTPHLREQCVVRLRFIPAHAGNTTVVSRQIVSDTVHPRACGEHIALNDRAGSMSGSSPRMRGTPVADLVRQQLVRFIPAHAGNTSAEPCSIMQTPVHPRACGEHGCKLPGIFPPHGSSPRMRGTRITGANRILCPRFIPAHAGNTPSPRTMRSPTSVHPRACGEHVFRARCDGDNIGSSPRMRGTRHAVFPQLQPHRFIPAHAGNTSAAVVIIVLVPVHPRACGEHYCSEVSIVAADGSSPRMRGTLLL